MKIKISKIRPDASNKRSTGKDISELAESIKQFGLLQPIGVTEPDKKGIHTIIFGHRRYAAVSHLGMDEIDAEIISESDSVTKMIQLTENIHRSDIHPMDEARTIGGLLNDGETQSFVAQTLGKSVPYIRKRMALNDLIEPIQEAFIRGNIDITMAYKLAALHQDIQQKIYEDNEDDFTQEGATYDSEWHVEKEMRRLNMYKFDKTECNSCPFNSNINELFGDEDPKCGNPACLYKKQDEYSNQQIEEAKSKVAYFVYSGYGKLSENDSKLAESIKADGYTVLINHNHFDEINEPDADDYTDGESDPDFVQYTKRYEQAFLAYDIYMKEYIRIELSADDVIEEANTIAENQSEALIQVKIQNAKNEYDNALQVAKRSMLCEITNEITLFDNNVIPKIVDDFKDDLIQKTMQAIKYCISGRCIDEDVIDELKPNDIKNAALVLTLDYLLDNEYDADEQHVNILKQILQKYNSEKYLEIEGQYLNKVEKLTKANHIKIQELESKK